MGRLEELCLPYRRSLVCCFPIETSNIPRGSAEFGLRQQDHKTVARLNLRASRSVSLATPLVGLEDEQSFKELAPELHGLAGLTRILLLS